MKNMNRRQILGTLGCAAVGGALLGTAAPTVAAPAPTEPFSWTPHKLDPKECAPVAYAGYWHQGLGCCYGVFDSIIGVMGQKFGAPYNTFPKSMMEFGKSGISGWGTTCGALIGAASAFALFWGRKERDPMVTELFRWYEKAMLPVYTPATPKIVMDKMPQTMADSVLCHISASKWSHTTGIDMHSKQRSERCARVTADVAMKAIEIMNAKIDGSFALLAKDETVSYCGDCHGKKKEIDDVKGKMTCAPCHSDKLTNHP